MKSYGQMSRACSRLVQNTAAGNGASRWRRESGCTPVPASAFSSCNTALEKELRDHSPSPAGRNWADQSQDGERSQDEGSVRGGVWALCMAMPLVAWLLFPMVIINSSTEFRGRGWGWGEAHCGGGRLLYPERHLICALEDSPCGSTANATEMNNPDGPSLALTSSPAVSNLSC